MFPGNNRDCLVPSHSPLDGDKPIFGRTEDPFMQKKKLEETQLEPVYFGIEYDSGQHDSKFQTIVCGW